jgi:hypothetical protein
MECPQGDTVNIDSKSVGRIVTNGGLSHPFCISYARSWFSTGCRYRPWKEGQECRKASDPHLDRVPPRVEHPVSFQTRTCVLVSLHQASLSAFVLEVVVIFSRIVPLRRSVRPSHVSLVSTGPDSRTFANNDHPRPLESASKYTVISHIGNTSCSTRLAASSPPSPSVHPMLQQCCSTPRSHVL